MRRIALAMLSLLALACSNDIDEVTLEEITENTLIDGVLHETAKEGSAEHISIAAPIFEERTFTIDEHAAPGSLIGTLSAKDANGDSVTYALESDIDLDLNTATGEIRVGAQLHLDHETAETLKFDVSAFNGKSISKRSFNLEVQDVNEVGLLTEDQAELVDYFQYLTLWQGPYVKEVEVNRRWNEPMLLYLDGTISKEFKATVEKVIAEYNELFEDGDFSISLTDDSEAANSHLFFGTKQEVESVWPDMYNIIKKGNYDGYAMTPSQNAVLISTRIWISNPIESLFKHEVGHTLGLGHSNQCEEKSIMCSQVGAKSDFSQEEASVIRYLYHNEFSAGLSATDIEKKLANLIVNEEN